MEGLEVEVQVGDVYDPVGCDHWFDLSCEDLILEHWLLRDGLKAPDIELRLMLLRENQLVHEVLGVVVLLVLPDIE